MRQGFHYHLRRALDAWVMSPEVADATMLEFVSAWNVKMEHNHMGRPHWGLRDLEVLDSLKVSDSNAPLPLPTCFGTHICGIVYVYVRLKLLRAHVERG